MTKGLRDPDVIGALDVVRSAPNGCAAIGPYDLNLVDYGYGTPHRDFLAESTALARNIITNPPYGRGLGDAFAKHALELTAPRLGKVAMLLPIHSLCHPIRHPFFERYRPATVYALDECHCWPNGDERQATKSLKAQRYCWIVWDHTHRGPTRIVWLTTAAYKSV